MSKFYLGPQIGLLEFDGVDFSISWHEEPIFRSEVTIVGNEKEAVVFVKKNKELLIENFEVLEYQDIRFSISVSNDATYPEFYHFSKEKGAKFAVAFEKANKVFEYMQAKYRAWVHAQESGIIIFSVVNLNGNIRYGVYRPTNETADNSGIVIESGAPSILEVELK